MIRILTLLLFPVLCQAANTEYYSIRKGFFKLESDDKTMYTIIRTDYKQIEKDGKSGVVTEYEINWISDSTYFLVDREPMRVLGHRMNFIPRPDTIYYEIVEMIGDRHRIISYNKFLKTNKEFVYKKLDSSKLYSNLGKVSNFREYYDGILKGGTSVSSVYSIFYLQHCYHKNDFVVVFQERLSNSPLLYLLHDFMLINVDSTQGLAINNCRFENTYDKEIVAIYNSINDNEESKIIKAWRFNRRTLKIEVVDIDRVKFRVEDSRHLFLGDK